MEARRRKKLSHRSHASACKLNLFSQTHLQIKLEELVPNNKWFIGEKTRNKEVLLGETKNYSSLCIDALCLLLQTERYLHEEQKKRMRDETISYYSLCT
jgi:hypothetical protein